MAQALAATLPKVVATIVLASVMVVALNLVVDMMLESTRGELEEKREGKGSPIAERTSTFALEALAVTMQQPVRVLVPLVAGLLVLRELLAGLCAMYPGATLPLEPLLVLGNMCVERAVLFVKRYSELVLVVILSWCSMTAKDALFRRICGVLARADNRGLGLEDADLLRALGPVSDLAGWIIAGVTIAVSCMVVGINVQPLLLTGGFSGAVLALASQSILSNLVSGVNLFLSRPFVVGDRVVVKGPVSVSGTVEAVDYTRTLVRTDQLLPVLIPNKALLDAVIVNESRAKNPLVRSAYTGPRQLNFSFFIPNKHVHKAAAISAEIRRYLREENDLVDNRLALYAWMTGLQDLSAVMTVNVYTTTRGSRAFAAFREQLLVDIFGIVRSFGATVADVKMTVEYNYDMGEMPEAAREYPWQSLAPPPPPPPALESADDE